MSGCCDLRAYEDEFSEKSARGDAAQYRRKGLDATARRFVEYLVGRGVTGSSVLEIGGGVGAIQIELLRAGAAQATNVEIVHTYEEAARSLLREHGLEDRAERHVFDFARNGDTVASADIVVMHRVICCYPDMERLVSAAALHAHRYLAMTFPPDRWWWHLFALLLNS